MHFSGDEDADFSLGPGGRSRLSSLFPSQTTVEDDPNQALIYTAPKQPKKHQGAQDTSNTSGTVELLHAVAVHTYVFENGKYLNQGKAGAAILGNHEMSEYKLLLYKGKQQKITCCLINSEFNFHIQEKNYASFYDEKRENWSIMFNSVETASEFAKQIAIAKANSCGNNLATVIVQDLIVGEGSATLEEGHVADVRYSGWIFSNRTLGPVFDSNMNSPKPFRFKLGKSQVIKGWSGLAGSKKGTKRLLIIPPAFAYGSEGIHDKVPPNSILIFEVFVTKIKESRDTSHSSSPAKGEGDLSEKKPEILPKPISNDDTIRMRGASISELLTQSPKKVNATIISRMAKMGTATLPLQGSVVALPSSESEAEEDCFPKADSPTLPTASSRSRESSPKPLPKPRTSSVGSTTTNSLHLLPLQGIPHTHTNPQTSAQLQIYPQANVTVPHHQVMTSTLQMYHPAATQAHFPIVSQPFPSQALPNMSPSVVSGMADSHLTFLLADARSQNTEVRMSLSKISDKIDTVFQKIEGITVHDRLTGHNSLPYMEGNILMQNIQRIVQENSQFKEEIDAKNSKIQSLNEKICDLLQKSQRFFEESSNILEHRSESAFSQTKLISLEQEKSKLELDLKETTAKLYALQTELDNCKIAEEKFQDEWELSNKESKKHKELVNDITEKAADQEKLVIGLQEKLNAEKQEKRELLLKVHNFQEKINDLESVKELLEKSVNEKRKKIEEMMVSADSEMEEIRVSYERDIRLLKAKLKQKHSIDLEQGEGDAEFQDQVHYQELESLKQDKANLLLQLENMKLQLNTAGSTESPINREGLQSDSLWKIKYESLCESANTQKVKYENYIIELKDEISSLRNSRKESTSNTSTLEFADEIKKAMSVLYRTLQTNLDASKNYTGSEVLEISLLIIRGLTLQLLEKRQQSKSIPQLHKSEPGKSTSSIVQKDYQPIGASPKKMLNEIISVSNFSAEEVPTNDLPISESSSANSLDVATENSINEPNECSDQKYEDNEISRLNSEQNSDNTFPALLLERKNEITSEGSFAEEPIVNSINENATKSEVPSDPPAILAKETERKTPDIWKPQPPPLFDDDDDDDDDWLK